jgi:antitoxin VapB
MNKLLTAEQLVPQRQTTTVFTSGNSQAVRLPKAFRFSSKTVQIERRGDEIVLREHPMSLGQRLADVMADLPKLSAQDAAALEVALSQARELRPPQERDWEALLGPADEPTRTPLVRKRRKAA